MYSLYIDNIKDYNIEDAKSSLSTNILDRCNKYKIESKKNQSIIGYYLLKKYLKDDYNIELSSVLVNEHGKPFIENIYFNISHSANMIAIIIADKPCGIDIEIEDDRNLRLERKILNKQELELIKSFSKEEKLEYIMRKWVSIEAYSKMIGKNFNLNLDVKVNAFKVENIYEDKPYYIAKFIEE